MPTVRSGAQYRMTAGGGYSHRQIAERALGRKLPRGAEVHHVDGDVASCAPRLVICQDRAYHKLLHVRARVVAAGGDPNTQRICAIGKELRPFSDFNRRAGNVGSGLQNACRYCMEEARRSRRRRRNAA